MGDWEVRVGDWEVMVGSWTPIKVCNEHLIRWGRST